MRRKQPPEVCPVCEEDVPRGALACPECGADENSGWREDAEDAELPGEEFDYDDFVAREFGGDGVKPRGIAVGWWVTGIVLIVALVFWVLR